MNLKDKLIKAAKDNEKIVKRDEETTKNATATPGSQTSDAKKTP